MLSNKVHEIMTTHLTAVPVTASVDDVIQRMIAEDVGRIVITDDEVPVGVFTEKDVLKRVVYPGLDAKQTLIKSVMSTPIRAVREETHIVEAFKRMYRGKFRHLLVRGRRGSIVGIVSMRRILKIVWSSAKAPTKPRLWQTSPPPRRSASIRRNRLPQPFSSWCIRN